MTQPVLIEADNLSSILGWVSIACWIIVYSPQIYENYTLKSGEGLSVLFVIVWLIGDLCNLVGAALAGLLPTVIILALYYSLCDIVLLCQIYYYRWTKRPHLALSTPEQSPLLHKTTSNHERPNVVSTRTYVVRYAAALVFVFATGVAAWWTNGGVRGDEGTPTHLKRGHRWIIQSLGWSSAILYLAARIPQILKNFRTRCEGLSSDLFLFAILGNAAYALSICVKSTDRKYLITNASWLAGSVLTIFLDLIVLAQFLYYRSLDRQLKSENVLSDSHL